jgi:hypothetical protein
LFDASVDLNPHQIEAALFALKSPLSKGSVAWLMRSAWARRLKQVSSFASIGLNGDGGCWSSARLHCAKQWALELEEKFNLPVLCWMPRLGGIFLKKGQSPLNQKAIVILSYNYANKIRGELKAIQWNLVVIDEAHKLRNSYRESNKIGQGLRWATEDCRKLLLTATPMQNSCLSCMGFQR